MNLRSDLMTTLLLTNNERKTLMAQAQALSPVVLLGGAGLTAPVLQEIDRALTSHELVKVRLGGTDREAREVMAETITDSLSCAAVQIIGKVAILYRPAPDDGSS